MTNTTITPERVDAILHTIPYGSDGVGFRLSDVFYAYNHSSSGTYHGEPYKKPAHVQIKTSAARYWIDRVDDGIELRYDPSGKMSFVPLLDLEAIHEMEELFCRLEDHLNIQDGSRQQETFIPDIDTKDFRLLAEILIQGTESEKPTIIQEAIESAFNNPEGYIIKNRESLSERGISKPFKGLATIALVDAMLNAGLCAEIDWNADHGTIQQAVFQLSQVRDWKIGLVEYSEDLPVEDYLKKLGSELSTQKLALISIDIDSDSYVLSLLKMELCEQAVKLGEKIGVKLKKW